MSEDIELILGNIDDSTTDNVSLLSNLSPDEHFMTPVCLNYNTPTVAMEINGADVILRL